MSQRSVVKQTERSEFKKCRDASEYRKRIMTCSGCGSYLCVAAKEYFEHLIHVFRWFENNLPSDVSRF